MNSVMRAGLKYRGQLRFLILLVSATIAMLICAVLANSANAALVTTTVFSTTQGTYSGDVSGADLLNGKVAMGAGATWNTTNGATLAELNDGIHGGTFAANGNSVAGAWTRGTGANSPSTATYTLGTDPYGYDLTSIVSIADWENARFGNQAWAFEYKLVGSGIFTNLTTVNYQPLTSTAGQGSPGGTKVTLTDSTGVLVSGVEQIRITVASVNSGSNAGAFVWRELDVFGTPTAIPEPSSIALLILGSFGTAFFALRRR